MSVCQKHHFHLVDPSPWPLLGSLGALPSTIGGVMYMHSFTGGRTLLCLGLGMILYVITSRIEEGMSTIIMCV